MKKAFISLFAAALALTVACCSDTKTTKETAEANTAPEMAKAAEPVAETAATVEGTKTVSLANGAKVTWIQDNDGEKLMPRDLFSDASDSLFASLNMPAGLPASVSTFLVQVDGQYILFDAGLGAFGGQLMNRLAALGVNPDSIGLVYLTHFHMDHIAGLVAKDSAGADTKVFKNAAVYAGKVEYDAWMNDIPKNDMQKNVMALYKDSLHLFAFGDSLPHGVLAMDAVGHTPGHTAFQLANLLVVAATLAGSRKRLMQYARDNKLLMAGMHLPPPGFAE